MLTNIHTLRWVDAAHTMIDLIGTHPVYGEIPFGASPNDGEAHGRDIFARAVAGEFGPIAEYVAPVKTPEEIQRDLTAALDKHIDAIAKAKGYDNRITCAMRAGYVNPWQAECIAFGQWMDQCYAIAIGILGEVAAQTRPVPTAEELIAELPAMVWP